MKVLLLFLFLPATAFAQIDSTNFPTREEVLKTADSYREKYGFKKELSFSFTTVELKNGFKTEGAFLSITPTSLVILRNGKEEVIPGDSISQLKINDLPASSKGFAPGFALGMYATSFLLNSFNSYENGNYLQRNSNLGMTFIVGLAAGAGIGYSIEKLSESRTKSYYSWNTRDDSARWVGFVGELAEVQHSFKTFTHFSIVAAYVLGSLKNDTEKFPLESLKDPYYSEYYPNDQAPFNFLRRVSFTISPAVLKGFEIGAAYMGLNELTFLKSGSIQYKDSSYDVSLRSQVHGNAYYGVLGYSAEVFKNTELRLGVGFGQANMDFLQEIRSTDYYYYYSDKYFPPMSFNRSEEIFSAVGLAELNYFYNNNFSVGLSGDYVWMESPVLPAAPSIRVPERTAPFTTFSLGLSLGFHF